MKAPILLAPVRELVRKHSKELPSWFVLSAGGILMLGGTVKVLDFFAKPLVPDLPDPIFAIPFRHLVLWVGMAELIVAGLCLFTSKKTLCLGLLAWLVANLAAYRVGLWTLGWPHPYAWLAGMINGWGVSPRVADLIIGATSAYLLIGSATMLRLEKEGRATLLRRQSELAESLKMSCFFCQGHIEFPMHALGQKIQCPHCKMDITLMKPKPPKPPDLPATN